MAEEIRQIVPPVYLRSAGAEAAATELATPVKEQ